MARAHHEAPQAEEPQDVTPSFDLTDAPVEEAPKKKRARSAPPLPEEVSRPKITRVKPFVPSEQAKEAAGLYHLREQAKKEREAKAKKPEKAEKPPRMLDVEVRELGETFMEAQAEFETVADAVDRRVKEIGEELTGRNFPAETIMVWSEAIQQREGLSQKLDAAMDRMIAARKAYVERYEEWEKEKAANEQAKAEMERTIDEFVAQHAPKDFTEQEENWFKQGEELDQQIAAAREEIEQTGIENEPIIETPAEIDATVRQAEAMLGSGDLQPQAFDLNDYRYLLTEKARLDADLEIAGWLKARKLRSELKEVMGNLRTYEDQIQTVLRERATAREKAAWTAKSPEQQKAAVSKRSFWSRITGR